MNFSNVRKWQQQLQQLQQQKNESDLKKERKKNKTNEWLFFACQPTIRDYRYWTIPIADEKKTTDFDDGKKRANSIAKCIKRSKNIR